MDSTPPTSTFIRSSIFSSVTVEDVNLHCINNFKSLKETIAELHLVVQELLHTSLQRILESRLVEILTRLSEGGFVLFARDYFTAGRKLALRWRGLRRFIFDLNYYFSSLGNATRTSRRRSSFLAKVFSLFAEKGSHPVANNLFWNYYSSTALVAPSRYVWHPYVLGSLAYTKGYLRNFRAH